MNTISRQVPDDRSVHTVTPLWCAAVEGRLEPLRVLAEAGADVNASSDSGSTPVRSACFMTHLDVVRYLVSRGADIHRPNHNGGTCLINSVQSVRLCTFLLEHGAEVSLDQGWGTFSFAWQYLLTDYMAGKIVAFLAILFTYSDKFRESIRLQTT